MKITACLPAYKIMDIPAVASGFALQAGVYQRGDHIDILLSHGYLVDRARQLMTEEALRRKSDYILNIDSDHVFETQQLYDIIERLEANKLQMLSAKYYVRNALIPPRPIAMCNWDKTKKKFVKIIPLGKETGIHDCDVVGNGFLVIKYDFMKKLFDKYHTLFKLSHYGEDMYFCDLVKKEGARVCYDADTIIGHLSLVNNK